MSRLLFGKPDRVHSHPFESDASKIDRSRSEKRSRSVERGAIRWNAGLLDNNMCRGKNSNHPLRVLPNTRDTKSEQSINTHHRDHSTYFWWLVVTVHILIRSSNEVVGVRERRRKSRNTSIRVFFCQTKMVAYDHAIALLCYSFSTHKYILAKKKCNRRKERKKRLNNSFFSPLAGS